MANYEKCMVIFPKITNSYHAVIPCRNIKTFPTSYNVGKTSIYRRKNHEIEEIFLVKLSQTRLYFVDIFEVVFSLKQK